MRFLFSLERSYLRERELERHSGPCDAGSRTWNLTLESPVPPCHLSLLLEGGEWGGGEVTVLLDPAMRWCWGLNLGHLGPQACMSWMDLSCLLTLVLLSLTCTICVPATRSGSGGDHPRRGPSRHFPSPEDLQPLERAWFLPPLPSDSTVDLPWTSWENVPRPPSLSQGRALGFPGEEAGGPGGPAPCPPRCPST